MLFYPSFQVLPTYNCRSLPSLYIEQHTHVTHPLGTPITTANNRPAPNLGPATSTIRSSLSTTLLRT
uniref:Uncharacterized protein n=1 Tax=Helianthus annuus TaxID=4232 RepID=A0A251VFZ8_HELAN